VDAAEVCPAKFSAVGNYSATRSQASLSTAIIMVPMVNAIASLNAFFMEHSFK
jgi:hypothetical protein